MKIITVIFCSIIFISCNEFFDNEPNVEISGNERRLPDKMVYSYECLKADTNALSEKWVKADELLGKVTTFNIEVTDAEQVAFGEQFMIESKQDENFRIDSLSPINKKLDSMMQNLLRKRKDPTAITYNIYLLEDTATINAYTVGGKIFITKAMINKCKNDDQLYAIIGHEIGHNEKGHIKNSLKQMKASKNFFGEWGDLFFAAKKLLTGSFNQKNELEADYFGLDLTWQLGYDVCAVSSFWDEMAKEEEQGNLLDFMRTHPYSSVRSTC
ncbi:MAG: M48 family metallopeptidase, partial [Ferruginibacter sp.]